ncbi:MAG: hypothetical protein R2831_05875 [Chitinophagaceae bacterium]
MKKIIIPTLILFFFVQTQAQYKKRTPEEKAKYYTAQLSEQVKLDSAQFEKIYAINIIVSQKFDSLYKENLEDAPRKRAMVNIFKYRDAAYREVLSERQFLIFDDYQREQYEKRKKDKEAKTNE